MRTDSIFYSVFKTSPETFFLLLGYPHKDAKELAARYQYESIEFKETAFHTDGVFSPREPELPVYFLEVQFYPLAAVYADVLAKAFTYLKQHDPGQPVVAVVLFGSRDLEPTALAPYQPLLDAGMLRRFYLDEMPEVAEAPLGLSILYLIRQAESLAPVMARDLIVRVRSEIEDESLRTALVELIETVIIYKLPRLTREEIQAMLQLHDIRESKVYQEAHQEGREKGAAEERRRAIVRLSERNMTADEISDMLGLDIELVCKAMAGGK
jgi:predicted transposase/invertase (TIGR01784 family)